MKVNPCPFPVFEQCLETDKRVIQTSFKVLIMFEIILSGLRRSRIPDDRKQNVIYIV